MSIKEELRRAIVDIRYEEVGSLVDDALKAGLKPLEILGELRAGLDIVGDRYQAGEYFLSQLFLAAETMKNALEAIQPLLLDERGSEPRGTIVIGSIEGDIHDFGKTIVSSLLMAAGFDVVDIGVDVPAARFVDEAERVEADVIGISALLSTTQPSSKEVVEELAARGLRSRYKVILGGTVVVPEMAVEDFGVDAAVNDGVEGVKIITSWTERKGGRA
ncbi:MAG: cobalamin-dependent protein [Candidatus Bathyarchaeota archaeon]|nr:cobalamin-dependent protein [Candidatus Bathyarchaeota archaeon]